MENLTLKLIKKTVLNGGYSVNSSYQLPKSGYMVSISEGPSFEKNEPINSDKIVSFIASISEDSPEIFFGGWIDRKTGKVYFDASKNVSDLDAALTLARQNDQIAIWDVVKNQEIRLK